MNRNTCTSISSEVQEEKQRGGQEATGCLLRIYWMLIGNAVLLFLAYGVVIRGVSLTTFDIAYWLGAASLIFARLIDIRFLHGTTADGATATMLHWRSYALCVLVVALFGWLFAHGIGYFVT